VIQKKICMVGIFATGKTSLVQQFIFSKFSEKYHSTVGVKIDRKEVQLDEATVNLVLWDLAGQDKFQSVVTSYLRGSSGIFFVVDGTRRETLDDLAGLRELVRTGVGEIPSVFAFNKVDLLSQWQIGPGDIAALEAQGCHVLRTSAKTGEGVEAAFMWLASQTLKG
jgi:small GTP-binding protein